MAEELAILGGAPAVPPGSHRRWPDITAEDRQAVLAVLDRGVLSAGTALDQGATPPEAGALEQEFGRYLGIEHCLALNSGTAALHCCTAAVGLGPGDEVVVPAHTFVSSALAVAQQGATPVFCDIQPDTFNICPRSAADRIGDRTRALLAVHIHGLPADMDELLAIAGSHGLAVIEDAAQAHGATYRGRMVGTLGDCSAFSLNVAKNLCGGEGGIFATSDEVLARVASRLSNFGEDAPPPIHLGRRYRSHGLGWNYRNHEMSAALARSQLRRLDAYNARAASNAARLSKGIASLPGVVPPVVPDDRTSVFHLYRLRLVPGELRDDLPAEDLRDRVIQALLAEGVPAGIWQHEPLPAHPVFRRAPRPWDPDEYPETERLLRESLIVGSGAEPIRLQEPPLMDRYAEAIEKVTRHADRLPPYSSRPRRIASATAAARSDTPSFS